MKVNPPGDAAWEWAVRVLDNNGASVADRTAAAQVIATFTVVDALDAVTAELAHR